MMKIVLIKKIKGHKNKLIKNLLIFLMDQFINLKLN